MVLSLFDGMLGGSREKAMAPAVMQPVFSLPHTSQQQTWGVWSCSDPHVSCVKCGLLRCSFERNHALLLYVSQE